MSKNVIRSHMFAAALASFYSTFMEKLAQEADGFDEPFVCVLTKKSCT